MTANSAVPTRILAIGEIISLVGVVLPLVLIGILKFTQYEVDALKPLISATPWLGWLYAVLGFAGTSYLLGVVELSTAALLIASLWSPRAGVAAGALSALIFAATTSIMLAFPIWQTSLGGFPYLNYVGQFLLKDVALLGISLTVLGKSFASVTARP